VCVAIVDWISFLVVVCLCWVGGWYMGVLGVLVIVSLLMQVCEMSELRDSNVPLWGL